MCARETAVRQASHITFSEVNMSTFIELKKNLKKDMTGLPEIRMAITGDCATQHLATAVAGAAYEHGFHMSVFDADYDEIRAQITDPSSELYESNPEAVLIDMCTEKLYADFCSLSVESRKTFAEEKADQIAGYWEMLLSNAKCKVLQFNFPGRDDRIFGNYANSIETSFVFQHRKLNLLLMEEASKHPGVYIIDLDSLQSRVGVERFCDSKLYFAARMPYSTEILPVIAEEVLKVICAMKGSIKKCVVLDLDNTLWGGVVGDDGLEGIQIGELGIGRAFQEFQVWLKELKKRGILLAICSKNDEDKAKEPFEKHPEMVLHLEDIACFVANWEDKASNIRHIRETLNLGMDSFVFIDDNPFERNLVRELIPDITVPEMPEDPAEYLNYLKSLNLFETVAFSAEDAGRTDQYRAEAKRTKARESFGSYEDYLKDLQMEAYAGPFDKFHYPRIAQLTQRSNQFNLRTVRYTQEEIEALANDDSYITLYFTLKDRFGDHGLVSVVIMKKEDGYAFVDTWLMSCRVLKRTMEDYIVNTIVSAAKSNGFNEIRAEYIPTAKNAMVKDIYKEKGFTETEPGKYVCKVDEYRVRDTYIND